MRTTFFTLLLCGTMLLACQDKKEASEKPQAEEKTAKSEKEETPAEPQEPKQPQAPKVPASFPKMIVGKWQSTEDAKSFIEFTPLEKNEPFGY